MYMNEELYYIDRLYYFMNNKKCQEKVYLKIHSVYTALLKETVDIIYI